jgi:hypothetical protein
MAVSRTQWTPTAEYPRQCPRPGDEDAIHHEGPGEEWAFHTGEAERSPDGYSSPYCLLHHGVLPAGGRDLPALIAASNCQHLARGEAAAHLFPGQATVVVLCIDHPDSVSDHDKMVEVAQASRNASIVQRDAVATNDRIDPEADELLTLRTAAPRLGCRLWAGQHADERCQLPEASLPASLVPRLSAFVFGPGGRAWVTGLDLRFLVLVPTHRSPTVRSALDSEWSPWVTACSS